MASHPRIAIVGLLLGLAFTVPKQGRAQVLTSIVVDYSNGAVLSASGADSVAYPASLTKMMTLYLTFEALRAGRLSLATRLPVSAEAARQPPSKLGLRSGTTIRVDDAIRALAVKSANDVAVVLAEGIGGTEARFAQLMSSRARELGMVRTYFVNASGLPDELQRTTARDMAVLAQRLIRDFPEYYWYFGLPYFVWRGRTYQNHNRLLTTYPGMDGIKTGYTRASGYNLVASAERNGRRLVAVVLGGSSSGERNREMARLLDEAFAEGALSAETTSGRNGPRPVAAVSSASPPAAENLAGVSRTRKAVSTTRHERGDFRVQLGAFRDRRTAGETARRLARTLPTLQGGTVVVAAPRTSGKRYVAQVVGLSRTDALSACASLRRAAKPCVVLAPSDRAAGSR